MKARILSLSLFIITAAIVTLYPAINSSGAIRDHITTPAQPPTQLPATKRPKVELVFVLDTTGSMGGLIQAAKENIWSIASTMAAGQPAPEISIGLVAYRDRGDAYLTRVVDLSSDLDTMYAKLMDLQAGGGGDGPEAVNDALYDAVHTISWSQDPQSYKVVFLVGDAPSHMDYQDDIKYPLTLAAARQRGIVVNTIQCGDSSATRQQWQQIAQLSHGQHFQVAQAGSAVAIATPFDADIALLSKKLDDTRLYYGSSEHKEKQRLKLEATDKLHALASPQSRARRATFNASASGATNFLGENELVDDIASGRVELSDIDAKALPKTLQALSPQQRRELVSQTASERDALKRQIKALASQRQAFVDEKVNASDGIEESLDYKIYSTIREQAGAKGLRYEGGPEY